MPPGKYSPFRPLDLHDVDIQPDPDDVGSSFDKRSSAVVQYLTKVRSWPEAKTLLEDFVLPVVEELETSYDPRHYPEYQEHLRSLTDDYTAGLLEADMSAAIIDVRKAKDGAWYSNSLMTSELLDRDTYRCAVNSFVQGLRHPGRDVTTRIVLFHPYRHWANSPNKTWSDTFYRPWPERRVYQLGYLFSQHIMMVELDMQPKEAALLSTERPASARAILTPNIVDFRGRDDTIVSFCFLGMRNYGECQVRTVVAYLGRCEGSELGSYGLIKMPSASATRKRYGPSFPEPYTETRSLADSPKSFVLYLSSAIAECERTNSELSRAHWLNAAISRAYQVYISELDGLQQYHSIKLEAGMQDNFYLGELRSLQIRIDSALTQLEEFIAPVAEEELPKNEFRAPLKALQRLAKELALEVTDTQGKLDRLVARRTLEMAELSMRESKSTIAITILAFAFVPISLASSIYGMNVQEVNQTGHGIRYFVVLALVLLLLSAATWLAWRAVQNWRMLYMHAQERSGKGSFRVRDMLGLDELRGQSRWMLFRYSIGLSPIENSGIGGFEGNKYRPAAPMSEKVDMKRLRAAAST